MKLTKRGKWTKTRYCKAKFSQKYNLNRHVKNVYEEDDQVYVGYDEEVIENAPEETMERTSQESLTFHISSWVNEEILNTSFTSETGESSEVSISVIDKDIWRLLDQKILNLQASVLRDYSNNPIFIEHNESVDCLSENNKKEIEEKERQTTKGYEAEFRALIINKIKDLRKQDKRESALSLLIETFGDFIHAHKFISWLSSKLDNYPRRLKSLINNTKRVFVPRNSLPNVYTHFG